MRNIVFFLLLILLFLAVAATVLEMQGVLDEVWYSYFPEKRPRAEYPIPDPKTTAEFLQIQYGQLLDERVALDKDKERVEIEKMRIDDTIKKNAKTLEELQKQRAELAKKETELKDINTSIQKTDTQMQTVKETMTESSTAVTDDELLKIVNIYNKMNVKKSAAILANMDDEFLIRLFRLMKPAVVGKILIEFPPQRAAGISKRLKG